MLRSLLAGVLFLPSFVVAQQQGPVKIEKPVICGPTDLVMEEIINHKELPIWGSQLENSKVALFANPDTETWTMVQWNKDFACVIEAGKGYFLKDPKAPADPYKFRGT